MKFIRHVQPSKTLFMLMYSMMTCCVIFITIWSLPILLVPTKGWPITLEVKDDQALITDYAEKCDKSSQCNKTSGVNLEHPICCTKLGICCSKAEQESLNKSCSKNANCSGRTNCLSVKGSEVKLCMLEVYTKETDGDSTKGFWTYFLIAILIILFVSIVIGVGVVLCCCLECGCEPCKDNFNHEPECLCSTNRKRLNKSKSTKYKKDWEQRWQTFLDVIFRRRENVQKDCEENDKPSSHLSRFKQMSQESKKSKKGKQTALKIHPQVASSSQMEDGQIGQDEESKHVHSDTGAIVNDKESSTASDSEEY